MHATTKNPAYFMGGFIICIIGAVCFSTKAIFVKLAYKEANVDAITLLPLRMIFSLPFFLVSALASSNKSDNVPFHSKQWMSIAVVGCLGYYISSLLDFVGLQYVTAGMERLILFVYPTLVLLMSAFIFKEKITRRQWLAVIMTYAGLLLAFFGEVNFGRQPGKDFYKGALLIFTCAVTYAMYIVGSGKIIPKVGAAKFNSYAMTFACIGVLLHFFSSNHQSIFSFTLPVYSYSLLMALLSTVIPSYLITEGIKRIGSDNAAIVGSIGPVSTILQAYLFLQEQVLVLQIIGTVLILFGVLLIGKGKNN